MGVHPNTWTLPCCSAAEPAKLLIPSAHAQAAFGSQQEGGRHLVESEEEEDCPLPGMEALDEPTKARLRREKNR